MGINIELDGDVLVHLKVKLLDTVLAKNAKYATLGVLSRNLDYIIL